MILQRFLRWLTKKKPAEIWFEILRDAKSYEEWEEATFQLDVLLGNDLWYGAALLQGLRIYADIDIGAKILPRNTMTTASSTSVSSQSS